jgi:dsRNA-specific ribonuclease
LLRKKFLTKDYLSDAAKQRALHTCLSMSQRQENMAAPPVTMKLVLSAIVGAVWLDANMNINQGLEKVKSVMQNLGSVCLSCSWKHLFTRYVDRLFDWEFLNDIN